MFRILRTEFVVPWRVTTPIDPLDTCLHTETGVLVHTGTVVLVYLETGMLVSQGTGLGFVAIATHKHRQTPYSFLP